MHVYCELLFQRLHDTDEKTAGDCFRRARGECGVRRARARHLRGSIKKYCAYSNDNMIRLKIYSVFKTNKYTFFFS